MHSPCKRLDRHIPAPTIDGSNWSRRIDRFVGLDNTNDRRAIIIWAKIAGASEAQYVTVNWASSVGTRLVLQQFHADKPYGFSGLGNRSANSATGSTGNTAATMAGTIPPLVVPDGPDVYTGFSDKQSILRISVMTARAGAVGQGGPAFANVGNLVEFTSAGVFQNALAVGFGAVHTELFGAKLNDTLTWNSDVLPICRQAQAIFLYLFNARLNLGSFVELYIWHTNADATKFEFLISIIIIFDK